MYVCSNIKILTCQKWQIQNLSCFFMYTLKTTKNRFLASTKVFEHLAFDQNSELKAYSSREFKLGSWFLRSLSVNMVITYRRCWNRKALSVSENFNMYYNTELDIFKYKKIRCWPSPAIYYLYLHFLNCKLNCFSTIMLYSNAAKGIPVTSTCIKSVITRN